MEEQFKGGEIEYWLVKLTKRINKEQWEAAGRPFHVIAADEQYSVNDMGRVYYRTWIPMYREERIVVASTPYTRRLLVGDIGVTGADLEPVIRQRVQFVAPRQAQPELLKFATGTKRVYTWDRDLTEATAQRFAEERTAPPELFERGR